LRTRFSSMPPMYYDNGGPLRWMQQGLTAGAVNNAYPTTLPQSVYSASTIMKLFGTTMPLFRPLPITDRGLYRPGVAFAVVQQLLPDGAIAALNNSFGFGGHNVVSPRPPPSSARSET